MLSTPLESIQRWMLSVITHPAGVQAGIAGEGAQQEFPLQTEQLESIIEPSLHCSSLERLSIYHNAYFARLIECLATEFPSVRHVVGENAFAGFVVTYLQQSPPGSYTLGDLGKGFADSLRISRPERDPNQTTSDWVDFLIDVATLERLYNDVFDGPGEELLPKLDPDSLRSIPPDIWPSVRLTFANSFRLAHFQFPVHEFISSVRRGEEADFPAPAETWLAVHRRDYVVRRLALSPIQYRLLQELSNNRTLLEAFAASAELLNENEEITPSDLHRWFSDWTAAGLFLSIAKD